MAGLVRAQAELAEVASLAADDPDAANEKDISAALCVRGRGQGYQGAHDLIQDLVEDVGLVGLAASLRGIEQRILNDCTNEVNPRIAVQYLGMSAATGDVARYVESMNLRAYG